MKLINKDFKKVMAGYRAVKTVLKSEQTNVTLLDGFALVTGGDKATQILIDMDVDSEEYNNPISLDSVTCDLLNKCKTKDDLIFEDRVIIGARTLPYSGSLDVATPVDISSYLQKFTCKASDFKAQLKGVAVVTAKDELRPVLQNVLLENSTLIAVDGFRIFTRNLGELQHQSLLLQKHTVDILLKLLPSKGDDILNIFVGADSSYYISWGDYTVIDTLGEGEFLKWQQVFTDECEYKLTVDRLELVNALEFTINSAIVKNVPVKCSLRDNVLQVGQDEIEANYEQFSGGLEIAFNPRYLLDSVKSVKDETVTLQFVSSLTPCIITHSSGKDLVLPIRLKG